MFDKIFNSVSQGSGVVTFNQVFSSFSSMGIMLFAHFNEKYLDYMKSEQEDRATIDQLQVAFSTLSLEKVLTTFLLSPSVANSPF